MMLQACNASLIVAPPPIRYMGTKRTLAPKVRELLLELAPGTRVADLFSGLGAVAASLSPHLPVLANDALAFASCVARARLLEIDDHHETMQHLLTKLVREYLPQRRRLVEEFAARLQAEADALATDNPEVVSEFMRTVPHVGNSKQIQARALAAAAAEGASHYYLAAYYFGSGYFSMLQAIEIDAVRFAIDQIGIARDQLLACWLTACSRVINSPGHTAQYLRARDHTTLKRVARQWKRSFWGTFHEIALAWRLVGTKAWRVQNAVTTADALDLLQDNEALGGVGVVYADPPYTKDQYSRFYHVYETLYKYDFPASTGVGRCRGERHSSTFCLATRTKEAFSKMFEAVAGRQLPLVLSYPAAGLLHHVGEDLFSMLRASFGRVDTLSFTYMHSTMGASRGAATKAATENLYVCRPA